MKDEILFPQKFPIKVLVEVQVSKEETLRSIQEALASIRMSYGEWKSRDKGKYTSFSSQVTADNKPQYEALSRVLSRVPGVKLVL